MREGKLEKWNSIDSLYSSDNKKQLITYKALTSGKWVSILKLVTEGKDHPVNGFNREIGLGFARLLLDCSKMAHFDISSVIA